MIAEFYRRTFSFLYNEQSSEQSLYQLKQQCLKNVKIPPTPHTDDNYFLQLEALFAQYVFNQFDLRFDTLKQPPHINIIELFSAPTSRLPLLCELPIQLQHFLYVSRLSSTNIEFSITMGLSQDTKDTFVNRVNRPPFSANHRPIKSFEDAQRLLTRDQFDAACCTIFIEKAFNHHDHAPFHAMILQEGVNLGYISSLIAQDKGLDPIRLFLTAIIRSISILLVHQRLQALDNLPSKKQLFMEIKTLLPRLDYWLAKDLGLPDDILYTLKARFLEVNACPESVNIIHLAERCQLSILLFKQSLISPKELQKILHYQGVSHLNLMHKLQRHPFTASNKSLLH